MNIKILTLGTRGDVQPFVALALALKKDYPKVAICTGVNFKSMVEGKGIDFLPIHVDYLKLTQSEAGQSMMAGSPQAVMKYMRTILLPMMEQMLNDLWVAAQDADVLIYHPKAFGGYDIAESLGIPAFIAHPVPIIMPTSLFTNPVLPFTINQGFFNKKSYTLNRLAIAPFMKLINRWRRDTLGLSAKRNLWTNDLKLGGEPIPVLYGCSPSVIPYDEAWRGHVSMEGFWFMEDDEAWTPPDDLVKFLSGGPLPIAISFSSMPLKHPDAVLEMMIEALRQTGQRGVILTGWSGSEKMVQQDQQDDHVYVAEALPHAWLFPRSCGAIHHGGAGTTAEALRAGKPMAICPFTGDQPFWAARMQAIGVAVTPLKAKNLSVEAFVQSIMSLVSNPQLGDRAAELSQRIQAENGVEQTVRFIQEKLARKIDNEN